MVNVESWLYFKGTCHIILLAKLHDMYLYKTVTFPHQPLFKVILKSGFLTQVSLCIFSSLIYVYFLIFTQIIMVCYAAFDIFIAVLITFILKDFPVPLVKLVLLGLFDLIFSWY